MGDALIGDYMQDCFDDESLDRDVRLLQTAIQDWATKHHIWTDCAFTTYLKQVDGEPPKVPVVLIQCLGTYFIDACCDDLADEFLDLVRSHGFYYEYANGYTLHFCPEAGPRCEAYASRQHWEWICSLVQPDFADVYEELYAHFEKRPEDLRRLSWRGFEVLLSRVFQAQGFATELGPGQSDGGVDIRLLQRDPLGDILTLVQAKKYAPKNRIGLEAVAALSGIAGVEQAQRSIFVTTSSYLPVAKRFAARTSGALELCTSSDVAEWCRQAQRGIIEDKSTLMSAPHVERLVLSLRQHIDPRLVRAHWGYRTSRNDFALVLKETKHAALLMALPSMTVLDGDGYGSWGTEVPSLDSTAPLMLKKDSVWRAKKKTDELGRVSYWDGWRLFRSWDGEPAHFDHRD